MHLDPLAGCNAAEVYFEGARVDADGAEWVCPGATATYTVEAVGEDGSGYAQSITIYVEEPPQDTPVPTRTPQPTADPVDISFWADSSTLVPGGCTTIHWDVKKASKVLVDGLPVDSQDSMTACPKVTTEYVLEAYDLDGNYYRSTLTLFLEEKESYCRGDGGFMLVVTDSALLNQSTGNNETWSEVQSLLTDYYDSAADGCQGLAVFLDIAEYKNTAVPSDNFIDRTIENFIKDMRIQMPAAVAIIGGPNVIPHQDPPRNSLDTAYRDDLYADFDHDRQQSPDTVITRLPDGGSRQVLVNYIQALASGAAPPDGALLVTDLTTSAHKLNYALRDVSLVGPIPFKDYLYLEDYIRLQSQGGGLTHLIAPPHAADYYFGDTGYENLIREDDPVNFNPDFHPSSGLGAYTSGIEEFFDHRVIVFGDFDTSTDLRSYIANLYELEFVNGQWSSTLYSPLGANQARDLPQGAEIFTLAGMGARLDSTQSALTIPLQALTRGCTISLGARITPRPIPSRK